MQKNNNFKKPLKIFIVSIESSADVLGAEILKQLDVLNIPFIAKGIGGKNLQSRGLESLYNDKDFEFYGFEILLNLRKLFQRRKMLIQDVIKFNPDIYLSFDGADLMTFIIRKMPKDFHAVKIHVVSPSLWAWRPKRAKIYESFYDAVLCLYPFELKYYSKGFARYVGHPGLSLIYQKNYHSTKIIPKSIKNKTIGLFLGSRNFEIQRLKTIAIPVLAKLQKEFQFQVVIPTFDQHERSIQQVMHKYGLKAKIIINDPYNAMDLIDIALACSGTVTMELTVRKIPHFLIYRLSKLLSFWLWTFLLFKTFGVQYIHIFNIILNRPVVPELLQSKFYDRSWRRLIPFNLTKKSLYKQFKAFIENPEIWTRQVQEIQPALEQLVKPNGKDYANVYVARKILEVYHARSGNET